MSSERASQGERAQNGILAIQPTATALAVGLLTAEALYDAYHAPAFALAQRMLANHAASEAILVEAFAAALRSVDAYDPSLGSARAWILDIVRDRCLGVIRTRDSGFAASPSGPVEDLAAHRKAAGPASRVGRPPIRQQLERLQPGQRTAIELAYFDGLTHGEIAIHMGIPLESVRRTIHSGLVQLAESPHTSTLPEAGSERSVAILSGTVGERRSDIAAAVELLQEPSDEMREINGRLLVSSLRQQQLVEEAEGARRRLALLVEASALLAASPDYLVTLEDVARLVVPYLADVCIVTVLDDDGSTREVAAVHAGLVSEEVLAQVRQGQLFDLDALRDGAASPLRGEREQVLNPSGKPMDAGQYDVASAEMLRAAGVTSSITVPLLARGRLVGVIVLLGTDPGRRFDPDDLALAEDLARRCAVAVESARLVDEIRQQARLDGVLLAARTAHHELNDLLALTTGYADLLDSNASIPGDIRAFASEALSGSRVAARTIERLQRVTRIEEIDRASLDGPILDIERSTA